MRELTNETKTARGLGGHTQETPGAGNGTWTNPGGGNAGPSARGSIGACVRKAGTRLAACLVVIAASLGVAAPANAQERGPYGDEIKAVVEVNSGDQEFTLPSRRAKDWFRVTLEKNKRYVIRINTPMMRINYRENRGDGSRNYDYDPQEFARRPRLSLAYRPAYGGQVIDGGGRDCFYNERTASSRPTLNCTGGKSWIDIDTYRDNRPAGNYYFYVLAPNGIGDDPADYSYSVRVEDQTSSSAPLGPLAAVFSGAPETHDGSTAFTMQLEFNGTLTTGWEALRDSITVTNGTLTRIDRVSSLSHLWNLEITPSSESFITIAVAPSGVCDGANGICAGGRLLEEGVTTKIYGTRAVTTVTNAEISNGPGENGTWDVGETVHAEVTFSSGVTIGGTPTIGITLDGARRDAPYAAYIGATEARFSYPITAADAGATQARLVANSLDVTNGLIGDNGGGDVILDFQVEAQTTEGLSIADAQATEGTDASLAFVVTLAPAGTTAVTVDYATADGTATQGDDYTATTGTLTFAPSETTKTITVPIVVDDEEDDGETLTLTLSNAVGAELTDAQATGTIRNTEEVTTSNALTAAFQNVPSGHDGEDDDFNVQILFDAALSGSWRFVRDAITITNGTHTRTSRVDGRNDLWRIDVEATSDADVTVNLRASVACGETGALCTSDSRRFETAISTVIDGPDADEEEEETTVTALTASFSGMPGAHDGETAFQFRIRFSEELASSYSYTTMRDHSVRVTQGATTTGATNARRMVSGKNDDWEVTVTPNGTGDISIALGPTTDCAAAGAMCAGTGEDQVALTSALSATVGGPPEMSIADATVEEAANATVDFEVTMSKAASSAVTVSYATSDGSALAGSDYTAASGTLTFNAGETTKTIAVTVLVDSLDEDSETFTMTLSNPSSGTVLSDATATGTITNTGPMPKAWLTRFGRTVASQAVDAIGDRIGSKGGSHVQVAGIALNGAGEVVEDERTNGLGQLEWQEREEDLHSMSASDLLLGTRFQLSSGGESGRPIWTAWGQFATGGFEAEVDETKLDGSVTSGFLGADVSGDRWLGGLALSISAGDGDFSMIDDEDETGEVESTLTSVYPYARLSVSDKVDVWAMAGAGSGDIELVQHADSTRTEDLPIKTDIGMRMGAIGMRGEVLSPEQTGGLSLAIKSDAFLVKMTSDAVHSNRGNLAATESDASRVRLALEGARTWEAGTGRFTPSVEIGVRHDGGDAETGTGVELGGGFRYEGAGVSIEGAVRTLVSHEESGYEEWGASGAIRIDRGTSGRGLALRLAPSWGNASSGMDQIWSPHGTHGLATDQEFETESRVEGEIGYGLSLRRIPGVVTPYTGMTLGDSSGRAWRTGARWQMGTHAALGIEANTAGENTGVTLRARLRF